MLKHRIIPIILMDGAFFAVQTTKFANKRMLGTTLQYIENMEKRNIDELILLDISGKIVKNKEYFKIKNLLKNLFCPITFGGGISTLDDIKILIQECGIDKISIRTNFSLIYSAARQFGSQAIVYAMDVKDNKVINIPKKLHKRITLEAWAKLIVEQGAGEILLTDTEQNGTFMGYNQELIKRISGAVNIPIIANGGCSSIADMVLAVENEADAVAASSLFALRGVTPQDCARGLQKAGVPVRVGR